MPCTLIVGGVGAGKTMQGVIYAADAPAKEFPNVFANLDLNVPEKHCVKWTDPNSLVDISCGVLFIDEADMWFNSRNYKDLNDSFRDLLKEHRKHHLRIVATTQHLSFIDKVMRIFLDEVWLVKRYSVPFLGLLDDRTIRPDVKCKCCNLVRSDDGIGDRSTWWKRWLFFGTFYMWRIYPPSVLGDEEDMHEIEEKGIPSRGWGWKRFNIKYANMYDTSAQVSHDAADYRAAKKSSRR